MIGVEFLTGIYTLEHQKERGTVGMVWELCRWWGTGSLDLLAHMGSDHQVLLRNMGLV